MEILEVGGQRKKGLLKVRQFSWMSYVYFPLLNEPKDICKMSKNCLVKASRHLAGIFSRCLKDSFFANLNSV